VNLQVRVPRPFSISFDPLIVLPNSEFVPPVRIVVTAAVREVSLAKASAPAPRHVPARAADPGRKDARGNPDEPRNSPAAEGRRPADGVTVLPARRRRPVFPSVLDDSAVLIIFAWNRPAVYDPERGQRHGRASRLTKLKLDRAAHAVATTSTTPATTRGTTETWAARARTRLLLWVARNAVVLRHVVRSARWQSDCGR